MDFSLIDYLDEGACYTKLVELLHPDGLACPRCGERQRLGDPPPPPRPGPRLPVRRLRPRLQRLDRDRPGGDPPPPRAGPADPPRHRPGRPPRRRWPASWAATASTCWPCGTGSRSYARRWLDRNPLGDAVVEADEMYQNAGEKGHPARRPGRPAAAAGQQPAGPRDVRQRPAAGRRGGRAGVGRGPPGGPRDGQRRASWRRSSTARAWRGRR